MKEMGLTYQEYQRTPAAIIDQIWAFLNTDFKIQLDSAEEHKK